MEKITTAVKYIIVCTSFQYKKLNFSKKLVKSTIKNAA